MGVLVSFMMPQQNHTNMPHKRSQVKKESLTVAIMKAVIQKTTTKTMMAAMMRMMMTINYCPQDCGFFLIAL
jgi:hypothetical protein